MSACAMRETIVMLVACIGATFCIDDATTLSLTVSGRNKAHLATAMAALQRMVGSESLFAEASELNIATQS